MNEQARAILDENLLGALATINQDGTPRATPLHFVADDQALYWFSAEDKVHSENITRNSQVSATVFSPDTSRGLQAVYISGQAEKLSDDDHAWVHELFEQRLEVVPPTFIGWRAYKLPIGTLNEQKSTGSCWYFYT